MQTPSLTAFWPEAAAKPSSESWNQWKNSFLDYLDVLPMWSRQSDVTKLQKVKLLRLYPGEAGQRYFDSLSFQPDCSVADVFKELGRLWGSQDSVFMARFNFFRQRQTPSEIVDDFISRLTHTAWACAFGQIEEWKRLCSYKPSLEACGMTEPVKVYWRSPELPSGKKPAS